MKKNILKVVGVTIAISIFVYWFMTYNVFNQTAQTDGFGRQLFLPHPFLTFTGGSDGLYSGVLWYIFDIIVIFGGIILVFHIFSSINDIEK